MTKDSSAGTWKPRPHDDRGVASVLVIACCALSLAALAAGLSIGAVGTARHRAAVAADLAAIAALQVPPGSTAPGGCDRAEDLARRMGASLASCELPSNDEVKVVVDVQLTPAVASLLQRVGISTSNVTARAHARARYD